MKLVCNIVGNMDRQKGKYGSDIRLDVTTEPARAMYSTSAGNVFYSIKVWGSLK